MCSGSFERWGYDKERDACVPFNFGGCKGNKNNYPTESSCNYQCKTPGVGKSEYMLVNFWFHIHVGFRRNEKKMCSFWKLVSNLILFWYCLTVVGLKSCFFLKFLRLHTNCFLKPYSFESQCSLEIFTNQKLDSFLILSFSKVFYVRTIDINFFIIDEIHKLTEKIIDMFVICFHIFFLYLTNKNRKLQFAKRVW